MYNHTFIPAIAALLALTACQLDPKDIGTPDSASEATQSSGGADTSAGGLTDSGSTTGDGPSTAPSTTDASAGTDTVSPSEPLDTETVGTDSAGTDPAGTDTVGLETDGEETEDLPPAQCGVVDPATDATFALDIPGWPDDPNTFGIAHDVKCNVDAVSTMNATVTTALTCDVEGAPLPATLDLAAAPEGPVLWQVGDGVRLVYTDFNDQDFSQVRALELRDGDDDDVLLVSAHDSVIDELFEKRFAPLTVNLLFKCGPPDGAVSQRVDFTAVGGDTLGIFDGHRDLLPVPFVADEGFAIDVERARADEFHVEGELKVLLRRVDLAP